MRTVIEDRGSRYAEGFVDGLARTGVDPATIEIGHRIARRLHAAPHNPA